MGDGTAGDRQRARSSERGHREGDCRGRVPAIAGSLKKIIEGLSLFPWIKELDNRSELVISDCQKCKQTMSQLQRQSLGCGYEPPTDRVRLAIWEPPRGPRAYHGPVPSICPGYTTALPEVLEAFNARLHWEKGAVLYACGGEPTEEMLASIVIIDTAYKSVERWAMTPASEGGGGK